MIRTALTALAITIVVTSVHGRAHADSTPPPETTAVLLMATKTEQGSSSSFGRDATEGGDLAHAIMQPFRQAGLTFVSAGELAPIVGASEPGLPLGNPAALDMARQAKASVVVVAGLVGEDEGRIRATNLVGQRARMRLRVLHAPDGEVLFDTGEVAGAGYGSDASRALELAGKRASAVALRGLAPVLLSRFARSTSADTATLSLTIAGAEGWRAIASILRRLAATPGVRAVHTAEIRDDRVQFLVSSQGGASSLVSSLRRARIQNGKLGVRATGNSISVTLIMTPHAGPIVGG